MVEHEESALIAQFNRTYRGMKKRKGPLITWKIEGFSNFFWEGRKGDLSSARFETVDGIQWTLWVSGSTLVPILVRDKVDKNKGPTAVRYGFQFNVVTNTNEKVFVSQPTTEIFEHGTARYCQQTLSALLDQKEVFLPHDSLTLQCHMWRDNGQTLPSPQSSTALQLPSRTNSHQFRFEVLKPEPSEFDSPKGQQNNPPQKTPLVHYIYDRYDKQEEELKISLRSVQDGSLVFVSKFTLLDKEGRETDTRSPLTVDYFQSKNQNGSATWKIRRQHLHENRTTLLDDEGRFLTSIDTCYPCEKPVNQGGEKHFRKRPTKVESTLASDMKRLLLDGCQGDLTLVSGDGVSLSAHRTILCARSAVFAAMMEREMSERQSGTVNIADMGGRTLEQLLSFLYTGRLDKEEELDCDTLAQLYTAGDKYEVFSLKKRCGVLMQSRVTGWNVCDVLEFSHLHSDEGMRGAALDALHLNSGVVLRSKEWRQLSRRRRSLTDLAKKVMREKDAKRETQR